MQLKRVVMLYLTQNYWFLSYCALNVRRSDISKTEPGYLETIKFH